MIDIRKNCKYRHDNGNCLKVGGFCLAVSDEHCERALAIKALQEPERKWIPVSERLPKNYKEVLVQWEMTNRVQNTVMVYISIGLIDEYGEWVNSDTMRLFNGRIIAWQPLPEPYKAGEQE